MILQLAERRPQTQYVRQNETTKKYVAAKEQVKNVQEQLNEEEIGNLSEKELRVMIVKLIQDFRERMEVRIKKIQEKFNKDLEEPKNKQTEMNNKITEMKNTLEKISSRITEVEERISDLEDRMVEISAMGQNKEKRMKRRGTIPT